MCNEAHLEFKVRAWVDGRTDGRTDGGGGGCVDQSKGHSTFKQCQQKRNQPDSLDA